MRFINGSIRIRLSLFREHHRRRLESPMRPRRRGFPARFFLGGGVPAREFCFRDPGGRRCRRLADGRIWRHARRRKRATSPIGIDSRFPRYGGTISRRTPARLIRICL